MKEAGGQAWRYFSGNTDGPWGLRAFRGWGGRSHLQKQFLSQLPGNRKHWQPPCLQTEHLGVAWKTGGLSGSLAPAHDDLRDRGRNGGTVIVGPGLRGMYTLPLIAALGSCCLRGPVMPARAICKAQFLILSELPASQLQDSNALENNHIVLFLPILLYGHAGSVSVWMPENFCSYFITTLS